MSNFVALVNNHGFSQYDRLAAPSSLDMLDFAYRQHDPCEFRFGYGGSVHVPGVDELFNRDIVSPSGEAFCLVDYGTRERHRIGILLPATGNKIHTKVRVLTKGDVPTNQLYEVTRQLAHFLMYPDQAHEYWI